MFGSDCFEGFCREGLSDVHGPVACGCRERTCAESVTEWEQLKCDWPNGEKSRAAHWIPGRVVRVAIGGAGCRRILSLTLEPVPRSARADMVRDHRDARGLPIEFVGANDDAGARPLSPGGEMEIYSSGGGARALVSPAAFRRGERDEAW